MKNPAVLYLSVLALLLVLNPLAAQAPSGSGGTFEQKIYRIPDEKTGRLLLEEIRSAVASGTLTKETGALYSGIVCHNMVEFNPDPWLDQALILLEPLTVSDSRAMAWYGSALTLRGGEASKQEKILAASMDVDSGFKWIDKGIKLSPDNMDLRILRILNGLSVSASSPFKRFDEIRIDLDWMEKRYETLSPDLKALYHWAEGELAMQLSDGGKASMQYRKAVKADPKGDYGKRAAGALAELED